MHAFLRRSYAGFQRLSFNGKVALIAMSYNGMFGLIFYFGYVHKTKKYNRNILEETDLSRRETDDWRCYNMARQYREECSHLDFSVLPSNDLCISVENALRDCRKSLLKYITVDKTPAMQPMPPLRNKPDWLNEPEWVVTTLSHNNNNNKSAGGDV
eukprot:GHVS01103444.1.p1 GENE.GHVS01103444.1~~GHVS01103444.1.p1  ORF type:complete len:156 (-),score=19.44 GHVS01103444.1:265-732(-)